MEKIKILMQLDIASLSDDLNLESIREQINTYKEQLLPKLDLDALVDWRLLIYITLRATDLIGAFKLATRYPSDKEAQVSISIPIPNADQCDYGLEKVKDSFFLAINPKKFHTLNPNYGKYENLEEYIFASIKFGIELAFTHGFTVNGKKVKFKN